MSEHPEELPDADVNGLHDLLFEMKGYTQRIHWWVRLVGVTWLVSIACACLLGALAASPSNSESSSSSYSDCVDAGYSAAYCISN